MEVGQSRAIYICPGHVLCEEEVNYACLDIPEIRLQDFPSFLNGVVLPLGVFG